MCGIAWEMICRCRGGNRKLKSRQRPGSRFNRPSGLLHFFCLVFQLYVRGVGMSNEARTEQGELTNEQLAARIRAGEDVAQNMAQLYDQMKGFIRTMAWKFRHSGMMEDLEQEGFLALYAAVDGYDPAQGASFLSYAKYHIMAKMVRYIQENRAGIRLSAYAQERQREYKRFCNAFQMARGREPSEATTAVFLGLTLEQVRQAKESARMASLASLDSPITGTDGGEDTTVGDLVASAWNLEDEALDRIQQEELSRVIWECVDSLPDRLPEVIRRRYQGGETLRQIGEAVGLSTERVRQMEGKALRELRKPSRSERLRPFLPEAERVYNSALKGVGASCFNHTWTSSTEREALRLAESTEDFLKREREETERLLEEARAELNALNSGRTPESE